MSMLKAFFEYGCNKELFQGLDITGEPELCDKYMGKFPVVSLTLKGVEARNYEGARAMLASIIGREALRFSFLKESGKLLEEEQEQYCQLVKVDRKGESGFICSCEIKK